MTANQYSLSKCRCWTNENKERDNGKAVTITFDAVVGYENISLAIFNLRIGSWTTDQADS